MQDKVPAKPLVVIFVGPSMQQKADPPVLCVFLLRHFFFNVHSSQVIISSISF